MDMKKLFALVGVLLILFASIYLFWSRPGNEMRGTPASSSDFPNPVLKKGELPPDLELQDLEGKLDKISNYKGKVVLINFWASWCPPCIIEMPSLVSAHQKLRDRGFEILAINLDEKKEAAQKVIQKQKLPFKVFLDPDGLAAQKYMVYGLPYTIILNREGKIEYKIFGGHEWDKGEQFEMLRSLL
ncbi:MAG: hypothetical protein A3B70_00980 [Deltaproteobacteria bacterium RIFCSPHIGHO2_02_FULL_40_11]|nr:MAG: hypothetical protein A3B70_00980 [Deltaproteobacteria bacterium RIFCSPHIGHO2_02_FULL_40_11]